MVKEIKINTGIKTTSVTETIIDHLMNAEYLLESERYQGNSVERYEMFQDIYTRTCDIRLELQGQI